MDFKKYFSKENFKKLLPFIIVGLVLGVVVYIRKGTGAATQTDTQSSSQNVDTMLQQQATAYQNNMQEMAQETNQAFTEQKNYYDQKMAALESDYTQQNTELQNKISQDEGIIQQQQDQNNTLYTSIHDLLAANSNLTQLYDNLQSQVKQNSEQAAAAKAAADQATSEAKEAAVKATSQPAQSGAATSSKPAISRVLKVGTSGNDVKQLQQALNAHGANIAVDGKYGNQTKQAVINYQRSQGIQVDGQVYTQTWGKLFG